MDNYELLLTEQARENIEDTLATLITAAQEISIASEKDFEKIKAKKWYKRLWELVTFNNDNQKIQARGVGNLTKLNEIIMKAIVLISKQSKDIAAKVHESLKQMQQFEEDVSDLYKQQIKIISVVQKIKRGFETEERFDELSQNQRDIIFAILHTYALEGSNDDTGRLLATLRGQAHDTYENVNYDIIETELTPKSSQKMLYTLVQAYSLLLTCDFANEDHEILQYIGLSGNEKKRIRNRVKDDISIYGKEEYIKFFDASTEEYDFDVEIDDIEWQNNENSEDINVPKELEVLSIANMVHISHGETKIYSYKEIHLGSLIHNCGVLIFDNCAIFYNENDYADEISLDANAEIQATNCTFVCKGIDKNPLITASEHCTAYFDKCAFIDCSHFILTNKEESTLLISNCEMYDCYEFAECGYYAKSFGLTNTAIYFTANYARPKDSYHSYLFDVEAKNATINNIFVSSNGVVTPELFNIRYGCLTDSTFNGVKGRIVEALGVENCVFENCRGSLSLISTWDSNGKPYVKSCVFDTCTDIIAAGETTSITQCKFINCYDSLIHSGSLGQIELSYCEFINYKNSADDQRQGTEASDPTAGIKISTGKGCKHSVIQKCVFDGVNINEGYLISSSIVEKVGKNQIRITECDFRNCVTKRVSGKIIKQYGYYYNLFSNIKHDLAITIENCRGLDKINKDGVGICRNQTILANVEIVKAKSGIKEMILPVGIGRFVESKIALETTFEAAVEYVSETQNGISLQVYVQKGNINTLDWVVIVDRDGYEIHANITRIFAQGQYKNSVKKGERATFFFENLQANISKGDRLLNC